MLILKQKILKSTIGFTLKGILIKIGRYILIVYKWLIFIKIFFLGGELYPFWKTDQTINDRDKIGGATEATVKDFFHFEGVLLFITRLHYDFFGALGNFAFLAPFLHKKSYESSHSTFAYFSKESKNMNLKRHRHPYVDCSIIHNSQDIEAT